MVHSSATSRPTPTFPEPVPAASQLAALPFLSALDGYLRHDVPTARMRITLHRAMSREGNRYLQQICDYLGPDDVSDRRKGGRIFSVDEGIMGAAFNTGRVLRTKNYASRSDVISELRKE